MFRSALLAPSRHAIRRSLTLGVAVAAAVALPASSPAAAGTEQTFIVLAPKGQGTAKATARVKSVGGKVIKRYEIIDLVLARSSRPDFASAVKGAGVQNASATTRFGTQVVDATEATVSDEASPDPATMGEPHFPRQWDMRAIDLAEAHSATRGSSDVVVGVLDSGIDASHPDLISQVDHARSASCIGGVANTASAAWNPTTSDHGTHVAGTVGAALDGLGIVGVAPGAKLASIKVVNDSGFIYPEAAVCGFVWAAEHGIDVTNNSYFIDPWEFNCRNDLRQRPIWVAVQRALRYAQSRGVLTVASAGNSSRDLAHKFVDASSPNDGSLPPEERVINGACVDLPAEAPGVITVSATGPTGLKSYYSNYGLGVVDVAAPGGDSRIPGTEPNGRVYSTTWPGNGWGYKQGTSMAAPHVAGLAALVMDAFPGLSAAGVGARIANTADPVDCPEGGSFTYPSMTDPQSCEGDAANNGFYGRGEVNALRAVTAPQE